MDKRTRAKLNIKMAQAGNAAAPWWELEGSNNAPAPEQQVESKPNNNENDGLSSQLFGSMTADIDPVVQDRVITLVTIIKELALKFYQLTLSDTEALKIAKENLKDISSRISHIPVEQLTDAIDDHINKIDKGVSKEEGAAGENAQNGSANAKANMPVEGDQNAPAQEAAPQEPNASFGNEPKMASKQASETIDRANLKEIWLVFVDLMEKYPELEPIYDQIRADFGPTPFMSTQFLADLKNYINMPDFRARGFGIRLSQELAYNGLPSRWLKVGPSAEPMYEDQYGRPLKNPGEYEPGEFDKEPKGMKEYYKEKKKNDEWDDVKLASYYNEEKQAINKHFNVETLQQFINVVKYNRSNFEYFLKNNSNGRKNKTPW